MTDRLKKAVDALVYAFFNDTLASGHCAACAVGNIVAWSHGFKKKSALDRCPIPGTRLYSSDWDFPVWHKGIDPYEHLVIEKTGYSAEELFVIEKAFEGATKLSFLNYEKNTKSEIMQDQYNGLMAVLDVLCEIEGIEAPTEYKELFTIS